MTGIIFGTEFEREAIAILRFSFLLSILRGRRTLTSLKTLIEEKSIIEFFNSDIIEKKTIVKSN